MSPRDQRSNDLTWVPSIVYKTEDTPLEHTALYPEKEHGSFLEVSSWLIGPLRKWRHPMR